MSGHRSAPMTLRVRNVMGVKKADVSLLGITLVAGQNGAGKSSLLEAAACAILKTPLARSMSNKKAAAALLHEGAEAGSIVLDHGPGQIRIGFPGAVAEEAGKPVQLGSALGINSARFMALKVEDRTREIAERFETAPTLPDLVEWFRDHPVTGMTGDAVALLYEDVEASGWDAVHKKAREHATKIKGRWEVWTGRRWGDQIARTWCPSILLPGEQYDVNEANQQLLAARSRLEQLLAVTAVGAAERERLQGLASDIAPAEADITQLEHTGLAISEEIEALIKQRNAKGAPVDTSMMPTCPHCAKRIQIKRHQGDAITLEAAPEPLTAAKLKEARKQIACLDGDQANAQNRLRQNTEALVLAQRRLNEARRAEAEVRRIASVPVVDEEAIADQRGLVLELERKVDAIKSLEGAQAAFAEWSQHVGIVAALEPEGVRRSVMSRRLSEVSTKLSEMATLAKFPDVALTNDMDATLAGRPYALLSESERWRVDLTIAATLGTEEGARVLLVDRLDVLHAQARPGVVMMLKKLGVASLVAMTAKDLEAAPDLMKAGFGVRRWLEKGVLADPA